jgi:hypothetical protein
MLDGAGMSICICCAKTKPGSANAASKMTERTDMVEFLDGLRMIAVRAGIDLLGG